MKNLDFLENSKKYLDTLNNLFTEEIISDIENLALELLHAWKEKRNVFICGNGGSAANAIHIANDFHYGIGACGVPPSISGLKIEALPANSGIITCLANDIGYQNIYSHQLLTKAKEGDMLIALSGSGNSPNIINALKTANEIKLCSFAILAFDGGECLEIADNTIYFSVNDMQIAEDTQLIIGHLCMQWLSKNKPI